MKNAILALLCSSVVRSVAALPTAEPADHMPPFVNGLVSEGWGSDGTYWSVPDTWRSENRTVVITSEKRDAHEFYLTSLICNYAHQLTTPADRMRAATRFCNEVKTYQAYTFKAAADILTNELCASTICVVTTQIVMSTAHAYTIGDAVKTYCGAFFEEIIGHCGIYEGAAAVTYTTNGRISSTGNSLQVIEDTGITCANVASGFPTPNQCHAGPW